MKRVTKYLAFTLATLMLASCGNGDKGTVSQSSQSSQSSQAASTASETEQLRSCDICGKFIPAGEGISTPLCAFACPDCVSAGAGGTTPPMSTQPAADEKITASVACTEITGSDAFVEMTMDNVHKNYTGASDYAYLRRSTGGFDTSAESPELFDFVNISCEAEYELGKPFCSKAGDVFGSLTVSSAETLYTSYDGIEGGWYSQNISFDGTVTLNGYITYSAEDDYGVSVGDIHFIPDAASRAENDFPIIIDKFNARLVYIDAAAGFGVSGDTQMLYLGNLMTDYEENAELNRLFDGSRTIMRATATISDISLHAYLDFPSTFSATLLSVVTI